MIVGSCEGLGWVSRVFLGWVIEVLMFRLGVLVKGWERKLVVGIRE